MEQGSPLTIQAASGLAGPDDLPRIIIFSHAHSPPLIPPAALRYNLRQVANPPRHIRVAFDGRSKRLRDHMRDEEDFMQLLHRAHEQIRQAALAVQAQPAASGEGPSGSGSQQAQATTTGDLESDGPGEARDTAEREGDDRELEDAGPQLSEGDEEGDGDKHVLRVSCFCAQGKHRSVAFAEELSRMPWPQGWEVSVIHRDVDKDHAETSSKKDRRSRAKLSWGRRNMAIPEDE